MYNLRPTSFLQPVLPSAKSRYSIGSTESDLECSISILENELPPKKTTLKKSIADRKLELLSKCIESMTQPPSEEESTKMPYFALFIGEK